jgi:hypothetical protein
MKVMLAILLSRFPLHEEAACRLESGKKKGEGGSFPFEGNDAVGLLIEFCAEPVYLPSCNPF